MINEMIKAYTNNADFRRYIDAGMKAYNRTFDEMLKDRITEAYYRSLIKGGCNWKGEKNEQNNFDGKFNG